MIVDFDNQKKWSVLTMNTVAFTANFAVWTMFSIIGIQIRQELGLNDTQFALLVAMPILSGSLSRWPLGLLADHYGGRIVFLLQMILVALPTYALMFASEYWQYLIIGFFVGLAGGSFAIGIAYTSAWFEREKQGMAMGIFGIGNAGAAVTNLMAPLIIVAYGWRMVPQSYAVAMLLVAVLFWLFTWPDPRHEKGKTDSRRFLEHAAPLTDLRVWRFSFYYFFVFGGFVALALWLPQYFVGEYGLSLSASSFATLAFTIPAVFIRPFGGWLSDRFGAEQLNWSIFWVCLVCLFFLSYPPTTMTIHGIEKDVSITISINIWMFSLLIFIIGIAMGIGNASVYRAIHDHYPNDMGSVGGMVGVIGGLGGFVLPLLFGFTADILGVRSSCFMLLYGVLAFCMITMYYALKSETLQLQLDEAKANNFLTL